MTEGFVGEGLVGEGVGSGGDVPQLGMPHWPAVPEAVDPTGASQLVICLGHHPRAVAAAASWTSAAQQLAPTRSLAVTGYDEETAVLDSALREARTGVRILVAGAQYDVLRTLALAREYGASPTELRSFVVDALEETDLPVYCAHCRDTFRMSGVRPGAVPDVLNGVLNGGETTCPGCARRLEVHPHHSALRGSFLASDARARELA